MLRAIKGCHPLRRIPSKCLGRPAGGSVEWCLWLPLKAELKTRAWVRIVDLEDDPRKQKEHSGVTEVRKVNQACISKCPTRNSYAEILTLQCDGIERRGFWEVSRP